MKKDSPGENNSRQIFDELEPLLGGTICLLAMTAIQGTKTENPYFARKIFDNLTRLSQHQDLSPEFRTVCNRLASRWQFYHGDDVTRQAEQGEAKRCESCNVSTCRKLH